MSVLRKFKLNDSDLLEFAAKTQGHFAQYHAAFTKLDPVLTQEWFAGFVDAAKNTTLDRFERTTLLQQTEDLHQYIERFHTHFELMEYYISLAFKASASQLVHFDLNGYPEARRKQSKLVNWCRKFGTRLAENREALLAVGAAEEFLTEVAQLVELIDKTNDAQEMSKDFRMAQTQERIITLNKLYKALQRLEKVAGFVFPAESRQLSFFKIPTYRQPLREIAEEGDTEASPEGSTAGSTEAAETSPTMMPLSPEATEDTTDQELPPQGEAPKDDLDKSSSEAA